MRWLTALLWLVVPGIGLSACSADVVAGADATSSSTRALLVVEQSMAADGAETSRSHASVWFLRGSDETSIESAMRLVTDQAELPRVGECITPGTRSAERIPAMLSPVELAFSGEVSLETAGTRQALAVRAFPDVANLLSGVMYTAPGQNEALTLGGPLMVRSSGAESMPAFEAMALAPASPGSVLIDGTPLGDAELEVRRGAAVALQWQPGQADDSVFVDVDPIPGTPSDRVRCALADTGQGALAPMAIPETEALSLAVHRVRVTALRAANAELGVARFDVAFTGKVKVAAP